MHKHQGSYQMVMGNIVIAEPALGVRNLLLMDGLKSGFLGAEARSE